MARKFLTPIDLGKNELQNAAIQNLASAPASPVKGQLYFNSTGGDNTLYWYDGTAWIPAKASSTLPLSNSASAITPGDAAAGGAASDASRGDHKHSLPGFGTSTATTTFGLAKADGAAGTFARSDHTHGTPIHDAAAHSAIPLSALAVPTGPVSFNGQKITSLGTPTAPADAVTKLYVDNFTQGLAWKEPVRLASTGNVSLIGFSAVDGVTPIANDRILVKNQSAASENGLWAVAAGSWFRVADADVVGEMDNACVFVKEGTTNSDTAWVCTTNPPLQPGSTPNNWVQFAGAGTVTAGAGLTQAGNTLNVIGDASITVAADQISRAALTGDVTAAAGDNATSIAAGVVTNAKLATMPIATLKGSMTGTGPPVDMTAANIAANLGFLRRFVAVCSAATSTAVGHSLGGRNVLVSVYRNSAPYDEIECDVEHTDNNTVTVRFATAPAASEYQIVVFG
jgi:hypothetical protein